MSHQVLWNKVILEEFVNSAILSPEEELVLRTRVAGWSRVRQAEELNMSVSNVDKIINRLKKKYDNAAKYNPILPPRKDKQVFKHDNNKASE